MRRTWPHPGWSARSWRRGAGHFADDLLNNGGRPRQVDTRPFTVGGNLAATPGQVVFRNDLMELIQYAPQTPLVRAVPVLASPPWINKYYVMDLAPGRSFLEWAIIGLCLGGALTAMLAAYLAAKGDDRIGSITLLNTLLDYSEPGVLGMFTDEKTVARLERQMAEEGVLEGSQMAGTFDMLRANDLIFNYVASNWLMGQDSPAFDILAWNGDSTRMAAAMHSFYLRSLYMRNELATGELELAGQRLSLSSVTSDAYVVGAINDHIVPWHGSYKTGGLLGAVRYALSNGGHIAGIVNPAGPKAWYEAGDYAVTGPDTWRRTASKHQGSWWEDWTAWSDTRAGVHVTPPHNRYFQDLPDDVISDDPAASGPCGRGTSPSRSPMSGHQERRSSTPPNQPDAPASPNSIWPDAGSPTSSGKPTGLSPKTCGQVTSRSLPSRRCGWQPKD